MIQSFRYQLRLIDPFGISRSTSTASNVVVANVDGGWGEAAPTSYMRENPDSVESALKQIDAMSLPDLDYYEDVERLVASHVPGNQAAKAALDIALYDMN